MGLFDPPLVYGIYVIIGAGVLILLFALFRIFFSPGEKTVGGSLGANIRDFGTKIGIGIINIVVYLLRQLWRNIIGQVVVVVFFLFMLAYGMDYFVFDGTLFDKIF
jgi:hypothetical protein